MCFSSVSNTPNIDGVPVPHGGDCKAKDQSRRPTAGGQSADNGENDGKRQRRYADVIGDKNQQKLSAEQEQKSEGILDAFAFCLNFLLFLSTAQTVVPELYP